MAYSTKRSRPDDDDVGHYVIAYDIGDDATRGEVSRVLTGFGERVQWSVFECWLSERELRRLARRLAAVALQAGDQVQAFACAADPFGAGRGDGGRDHWRI